MTETSQTRAWRIPSMHNLEVLRASLVNYQFPPHFHETFVMEWVEGGRDHCSRADMAATSGQLFVHGPRVVHAGASGTRQALQYLGCYPAVELVEEVMEARLEELPAVGTLVIEGRWLGQAAKKLFSQLANGVDEQSTRDSLQRVLHLVMDHASQVNFEDCRPPQAIERVRELLIRETHRNVKLEELERVSGLSRFHLSREFSRCFGISPKQFGISQRVSAAKSKIMQGLPIVDVSLATGFADQSHLTRCFKKVTGFSPGQLQHRLG